MIKKVVETVIKKSEIPCRGIETAENGQIAIESWQRMQEEGPLIVLIDYFMPSKSNACIHFDLYSICCFPFVISN